MNGRILIPGKPVPTSEIPDYTIARDTLDEVLSDAFRQRLGRLNAIVTRSGERLEGNVFYADRDEAFAERLPAPDLAPARRNLWRAARFKKRLLEVGVNAGHSALLALSSNPRLEYYGVDIMSHRYTIECVDFLKGEYPGRVHLFPGELARGPALARRPRRRARIRPPARRRRPHERSLPLRHDQLHPDGSRGERPAPSP